MGLFILVLFVAGALAFTLWASHEDDASQTAEANSKEPNEEKTSLVVALVALTLLSSFLSEILHYSLKLPFLWAAVMSILVAAAGERLALRLFGQKRAEN